ncbi:MAG TPA: methyltransferase domain-containing protein [Vicinamibacterales bacterium]|nr:methyltransferase domain-containing protein [Vicinamibacterales bacterium]
MPSSPEWNAAEYHRVSDPQVAWGRAVLARLELRGDERVIDAGCGTGRLTKDLAARLPGGTVVGLDASRQMLEQARTHLADSQTPVQLVEVLLPAMPIVNWADVVFSTATFHWVPDHPSLFANIYRALKPGGLLHAQCGGAGNLAEARRPAEELMALPPFAPFFRDWRSVWEFADDTQTAHRLAAAGFSDVQTSLEPAPIRFADEPSYRAFVETVVYRVHLSALPAHLRSSFLDEVVGRAVNAPNGPTLDYVRLNLTGRKR